MDGLIAGVVFYCFGYGIAFGTKDGEGNAFIGSGDFFLADTAKSGAWVFFFFHWAVVAAVTTIVAGGIAERCRIEAYAIYTIWISTIVYPVAAHWCGLSGLQPVVGCRNRDLRHQCSLVLR